MRSNKGRPHDSCISWRCSPPAAGWLGPSYLSVCPACSGLASVAWPPLAVLMCCPISASNLRLNATAFSQSSHCSNASGRLQHFFRANVVGQGGRESGRKHSCPGAWPVPCLVVLRPPVRPATGNEIGPFLGCERRAEHVPSDSGLIGGAARCSGRSCCCTPSHSAGPSGPYRLLQDRRWTSFGRLDSAVARMSSPRPVAIGATAPIPAN